MKKSILALLFSAATLPSVAQELRTTYFMETSDYRHEMNPALLDHSYVSMPLILGNINIGTTGNFGLENFVYKMKPEWQGYGIEGRNLTTFMHPAVDAGKFLSDLPEKSRLGVNVKYSLFSMGFKAFGGVNSIDLNLRSNTNINLPKSLFSFMKEQKGNTAYNIKDLGIRTENMVELGFGHSHKINDQWTVGAKVKFLFGLAYADVTADELTVNLQDDQWHLKGDVNMSAALMKTKFLTNDKVDPNNPNRHRIDDIDDFAAGLGGFGLGFDLGATYKVMEGLTVSAAITDLGFISWSGAQQASSAGEWSFDGFEEDVYAGGNKTETNEIGDQLDAIGDDLGDIFAVYDDGTKTDTRALAATINLGAEYALPMYNKLRFGFLYTSRLAGKYSWHQGMLSANIRPVKWLEASLNGAVSSTGATAGLVLDLHAKHFNFFIGADRFLSKLSKQGIPLSKANSSVSMGFSFPL